MYPLLGNSSRASTTGECWTPCVFFFLSCPGALAIVSQLETKFGNVKTLQFTMAAEAKSAEEQIRGVIPKPIKKHLFDKIPVQVGPPFPPKGRSFARDTEAAFCNAWPFASGAHGPSSLELSGQRQVHGQVPCHPAALLPSKLRRPLRERWGVGLCGRAGTDCDPHERSGLGQNIRRHRICCFRRGWCHSPHGAWKVPFVQGHEPAGRTGHRVFHPIKARMTGSRCCQEACKDRVP